MTRLVCGHNPNSSFLCAVSKFFCSKPLGTQFLSFVTPTFKLLQIFFVILMNHYVVNLKVALSKDHTRVDFNKRTLHIYYIQSVPEWSWKVLVVQQGTFKPMRVYASLCEALPVSASLCESLRVSASLCESLRVSASLCQSLPVSASLCESLRVSASLSKSK